VPGKTTRVAFGMDDVLHTFKKGHRMRDDAPQGMRLGEAGVKVRSKGVE
jgi:hypothetical protein